MGFSPANTRRWQRHLVDLPVRILPSKGNTQAALPGRLSEISEGGMALYAGLLLEPGDLMEVEFETPRCTRVAGIVRSKVGYCFGLEFLTSLPVGDRLAESQQEAPGQELKLPRSRAEIDVSHRPSVAPSLAPGERATSDEAKLDRILHAAAAKALQATGATGVAIGLRRKGAMICRATAGLPFPGLGVRINTESGLTAAAIRRQMSQWCSDTESDSRADIEVCRQLGVRSIIVVPVCARDTVAGVFGIFSAHPDAFSLSDLNRVKEQAQWVSEAIEPAFGNIAKTIAPVIARPGHSGGKQPINVNSGRTHGVEPRKYAMQIRGAIVLALAMLVVMLSIHWGLMR